MICSALHHHSSRILGCPVTRVVSGRAPHFDKSITLSLPGFFADGRAFLPHKPGRPRHPYTSSPTHPLAEPKGPLLLSGDRDLKINEGPGPSWYCKPCLQVDEISPLLLANGVDVELVVLVLWLYWCGCCCRCLLWCRYRRWCWRSSATAACDGGAVGCHSVLRVQGKAEKILWRTGKPVHR